jgi:hypothetical protein
VFAEALRRGEADMIIPTTTEQAINRGAPRSGFASTGAGRLLIACI